MDAERRARADAVFTEALDLEASAREACVRERCGEDHELADLVLRLLADAESDDDAFLSPGRLLEGPLWQRASAALESGGIGPGSSVGAWTVVRELGAGGMATVYLVRRREAEFSQQAALKLIKRGIDTDEVAHRFRQERQILASLDHPNVARLLDGGVSEDGRPYFVMEYVDGPPVDRWCEEQRATIEKRLALFLDVARAVEQAHRRLVVHRDLKPGNVLVDPRGDVKLLDFGIAKLLDPLAAAEAPATRTAVRVMTPEYASPEQVRGEPVTTASDVYQLGLLLYELLTRRRAHQVEGGSLTDIERVVCRQIPVPPGAIVGKLRGDLDTIVMKALAKEPDARYASVTALIEDVTRHLEGLPVKARRPTVAYRVHRFVRRHALAVAAAAVVLVSLVAGLSATLWQARVAARERDNARREAATAGRVSEFLIETFEIADPGEARGNTVTAREVLDSGTRRIGLLDDEPEIQSTMKDVMGRVYQSLGLYDPAHTLLTESLTMRRAASSTPDPRVADSLDHVGMLWIAKGKYDEAEKSLHEGLAMRRALFGESHGSVADSLQHLAQLEHLRDHLEEAGKLLDQALAIRRSADPRDPEIAVLLADQGRLWLQRGNAEQANALLLQAMDIQRPAGNGVALAKTLNSLGMASQNLEKVDDAGRYYDEALAIRTKALGPTHPDTSLTRGNLAALYYQQSDFARAAPIFRETVELQRKALGDDHPSVATSRNNLAVVLMMMGDYGGAEPEYREALRIRLKAYGDGHRAVAATRYHLGRLLRDKGQPKDAEESMRHALSQLAATDMNRIGCLVDLGEMLLAQGRLDEAGRLFDEAVATSGATGGDKNGWTAIARSARGAWYWKKGNARSAEDDLTAAWPVLASRPKTDKRRETTLGRLETLYRGTGREGKAQALRGSEP